MQEQKKGLARFVEIIKATQTVYVLIGAVFSAMIAMALWFDSNYVSRTVLEEDFIPRMEIDRRLVTPNGVCMRWPNKENMRIYHSVSDARPGEEALVQFYDLYMVNDCDAPCLSGMVTNGDGIPRRVNELSITGPIEHGQCGRGQRYPVGPVSLPPYTFVVPERSQPGCATFKMEMDFQTGQRAEESPTLRFMILNPDGSRPLDSCD